MEFLTYLLQVADSATVSKLVLQIAQTTDFMNTDKV